MKSFPPRYRLCNRDVEWGHGQSIPVAKKTHVARDSSCLEDHYHRVNLAIDLLYHPHIGEHLAWISNEDLAPWQRSCVWARSRRIHECVVRSPRAIVPFIDDNALEVDAQGIRASGHEAKLTEEEFRGLNALAVDDVGELELTTLMGKIAALAFFERTKWGRHHRTTILQQALCTPEHSYYLAAATNPTSSEWISLAESMSKCPRFSFAALSLPHLPLSEVLLPAHERLKKRIGRDPIFNWALRFRTHRCDREKLTQDIITNPFAGIVECGLSLVLAPRDPRVPEWLSEMSGHPQLAYEVRRLLSLSHQLDAEFLLGPKLGAIAMSDPLWAFHWLRDFGEDAEDTALSLFPNLEWIAELIDLGVISPAHANLVDDRAAQSMDLDHWLRSSFLLFSANKVKCNEKN
jgi:hypothetical protein